MDENAIEYFIRVCERPGMHVLSERFDAVCAHLMGHHVVSGALVGFREWLLTGAPEWSNLDWSMLVRDRVKSNAHQIASFADDDAPLRKELARSLQGFLDDGRAGGLAQVYYRYSMWVLSAPTGVDDVLRERLSKG